MFTTCKYLSSSGLAALALAAVLHAAPPGQTGGKPTGNGRTDLHDDPLPAGVRVRLGSVHWHLGPSDGPLAFAADGKTMTLVQERNKRCTLISWDTTTGRTVRRLPLPFKRASHRLPTADGRYLVIPEETEIHLIEVLTGKSVGRFAGGEQQLTCVAVSPDGKLLAAGCQAPRISKPSLIYLWDVTTGKRKGELTGHDTAVTSVAFSADGKKLLSASEDRPGIAGTRFPNLIHGSICVWSMPDGKLRRRIHAAGRQNVFSPDGHTLACMIEGEWVVHLWDLEKKKEPIALPVRNSTYFFLPDGKTLVTGSAQQLPALWDVATGKKVRSFQGSLGQGAELWAIAPNGRLLVTASHTTMGPACLRLWDVSTGMERRPFPGHLETVTCVTFSPDGKAVVSGSKDRTLRVWDAGTGRERLVHRGHEAEVTAVALAPDGKLAASGDAANQVHIWEPATGKLLHRLDAAPARGAQADRQEITFLRFTPDGRKLLGGSQVMRVDSGEIHHTGALSTWDTATGKLLGRQREEKGYPCAASADGALTAYILVVDFNIFRLQAKLVVRDLRTGRDVFVLEGKQAEILSPVAFSSDGKLLAVEASIEPVGLYGGGRSIPRPRLFELASGKKIADLEQIGVAPVFSPDDRTLACAPRFETFVALLDTATGRVRERLKGHLGFVECLAFSRHGRFLATGSADHTVLLWDNPPLRAAARGKALDAKELDALWADLASIDAARGYRAVWTLVDAPRQALDLLRARLHPVAPVPAARMDALIRDLDADQFPVRQKARVELEKLGPLAVPALRKLLAGRPTVEQRQQAKRLLASAEKARRGPEGLRNTRAIAVLEHIGTAEARLLLRSLANGAAEIPLSQDARDARERLRARVPEREAPTP